MNMTTQAEHQSAHYLTLDESNHVDKPFLDQLDGLGWEIIDFGTRQHKKMRAYDE
jgi:hypothetical protein